MINVNITPIGCPPGTGLPSNEQDDTLSTGKRTIKESLYIRKRANDGKKEDKSHNGANGNGPYHCFWDLDGGIVDLFAHTRDWKHGLCEQVRKRNNRDVLIPMAA